MDKPSLSFETLETSDPVPLRRVDSGSRWQRRARRFRRNLSLDTTRRVLDLEPVDERETLSPSSPQNAMLTQNSFLSIPEPATLSQQSNDLILAALGRGRTPSGSAQASGTSTPVSHKPATSALAALGLRTATAAAAGSSDSLPAPTAVPASSKLNKSFLMASKPIGGSSSRASNRSGTASGVASGTTSRSPSPFFRARKAREERRERSPSPDIVALRKDSTAAESDIEGPDGRRGRFRPRGSAYESPESSGNEADDNDTDVEKVRVVIADKPVEKTVVQPQQDDYDDDDQADDEDEEPLDYDDDDLWDPETFFDEETEKNTEANAYYADNSCEGAIDQDTKRDNFDVFGEDVEQDVLGEGPNVVVPPEPLFAKPGDKIRKSERSGLDLVTSRPTFARDRCTITLTQGHPDVSLDESGKRMRRYVVLSDLSEESRYAVEWAIGTVARDGDEVFVISVMENEDKVDPKHWSNRDQANKLKVQKEVGCAGSGTGGQYSWAVLTPAPNDRITPGASGHWVAGANTPQCHRHVPGAACEERALHAARPHRLPRTHARDCRLARPQPAQGVSSVKWLLADGSILLGSTSHYLVQKSSVPVMVARRRLRRPLRRTNPEDLRRSPRVSLASANIEKSAPKKQEDDVVDAADDEEDDATAQKGGESVLGISK